MEKISILELILEKVNLVKQLRAHLDFTLKLNKKISLGISTVKKTYYIESLLLE